MKRNIDKDSIDKDSVDKDSIDNVHVDKGNIKRAVQLLAATAMLLLTAQVDAQAMTVFGSGEAARSCGQEAELASSPVANARKGVELCSFALEHERLTQNDRAATLVNRGILLTATRQYEQALDDYNRARELQPALAEPYIGRGNLVFLAGHFDLAISEYNQALTMMLSRRHVGYFNRGLAYEKRGMQEEAIADYQQALAIKPDWALPQERINKLAGQAE